MGLYIYSQPLPKIMLTQSKHISQTHRHKVMPKLKLLAPAWTELDKGQPQLASYLGFEKQAVIIIVEQVDGNATLTDDDVAEDDKYSDTSHYWKTGLIETEFQTFLDANEIINSSNLSEVTKEIEKTEVLEARKCAFGENYKYVPPWKQWLFAPLLHL